MEGLFWLSEEQLERIQPFFPKSRGVSRVDDRKVLSGIIYVQRHGLRSRGCPSRLWTLQNPLQPLPPLVGERNLPVDLLGVGPIRRHRARSQCRTRSWCGARGGADGGCHLHQSPSHCLQPQKGGTAPRLIGRTKGGLTSKLHVVCDGKGRPIRLHLSEGQCRQLHRC